MDQEWRTWEVPRTACDIHSSRPDGHLKRRHSRETKTPVLCDETERGAFVSEGVRVEGLQSVGDLPARVMPLQRARWHRNAHHLAMQTDAPQCSAVRTVSSRNDRALAQDVELHDLIA